MSLRTIARQLRRAPSTISREVRDNGAPHRLSGCAIGSGGLGSHTSPQARASSHWSRRRSGRDSIGLSLSSSGRAANRRLARSANIPPTSTAACLHETIYRSLFIQTRGVLKKELLAHLRATRAIRRRPGTPA